MEKRKPVIVDRRPEDNTKCPLYIDNSCDGVNCDPNRCDKIISYVETICAETADLYLG